GALHRHIVADADVALGDVIGVVQAGVAHRHPADHHRFELGVRREHASTPNVDHNIQHAGGGLAGREFVGHSPARIAADHAELALLSEIVDLDHDPIGLVFELVAPGHPLAA